MAIKQSRYIDISSTILKDVVGNRSVSGLVFTQEEMLDTADAIVKASYDGGKVVALSYEAITTTFGPNADVTAFATKYFSYIAPNGGTPRAINVFKVASGTKARTAFDAAVKDSTNFMTFTFLGSDLQEVGDAGDLGLLDVALSNNAIDNPFAMVVAVTKDNAATVAQSFTGMSGVHLVAGADEYAAYMPMAFVAATDYTKANAAGDLFGKQFGSETAVVTDDTTANAFDSNKVNYIGLTQVNGTEFSFYQRGDNQDGVALGIYANEMWLRSELARAWFNLLLSVQKVPANADGLALIANAFNEVAAQGIDNGSILIDKPLTSTQRTLIATYTDGNTSAADSVQDTGYYLNVEIKQEDNEYHAYFTLVYAKGDAIRKVVGSNVLV